MIVIRVIRQRHWRYLSGSFVKFVQFVFVEKQSPRSTSDVYFEHEICRRPTDHREVIPRITRMTLIVIRVIRQRHWCYLSVAIRQIRAIRVR